jgi:hypothetical protein
MIEQCGSGRTAEDAVLPAEEIARYGTDWEASTQDEGRSPLVDSSVIVPPSSIHLTDEMMEELQSRVNPLGDSDCWGVDLYLDALATLR